MLRVFVVIILGRQYTEIVRSASPSSAWPAARRATAALWYAAMRESLRSGDCALKDSLRRGSRYWKLFPRRSRSSGGVSIHCQWVAQCQASREARRWMPLSHAHANSVIPPAVFVSIFVPLRRIFPQ